MSCLNQSESVVCYQLQDESSKVREFSSQVLETDLFVYTSVNVAVGLDLTTFIFKARCIIFGPKFTHFCPLISFGLAQFENFQISSLVFGQGCLGLLPAGPTTTYSISPAGDKLCVAVIVALHVSCILSHSLIFFARLLSLARIQFPSFEDTPSI